MMFEFEISKLKQSIEAIKTRQIPDLKKFLEVKNNELSVRLKESMDKKIKKARESDNLD